jgi:hypothetical protein
VTWRTENTVIACFPSREPQPRAVNLGANNLNLRRGSEFCVLWLTSLRGAMQATLAEEPLLDELGSDEVPPAHWASLPYFFALAVIL